MPGRLDSKVAIVTGAGCVGPGWGNGRAAVAAFVREDAQIFAIDLGADAMAETVARAQEVLGANGGGIRTIPATVWFRNGRLRVRSAGGSASGILGGLTSRNRLLKSSPDRERGQATADAAALRGRPRPLLTGTSPLATVAMARPAQRMASYRVILLTLWNVAVLAQLQP